MKKKVFFNYLFLQKVKLLADSTIAFKRQEYLVQGLWILFYEILNHRDYELLEYVNNLESKNSFIKIDTNFTSIFSSLGTKFKGSVARIFNNYKLKEYINIAHSDVMYIEEDCFYINIKMFLLRYKDKNHQYLAVENHQFIANIFTYINKFQGRKTQDILYCLALGMLINTVKTSEFSIVQITKQVDYNITRVSRLLHKYLELLVLIKAIDSYEYHACKNSFIINKTANFITAFKSKTFIKKSVKDIFSKIKHYKLNYIQLFELLEISIHQKHILIPNI